MVHSLIFELRTWQKSGCQTNRSKPAVGSHVDGTQTGRVGIWHCSRIEFPRLPRQDGARTGSRPWLRWSAAL